MTRWFVLAVAGVSAAQAPEASPPIAVVSAVHDCREVKDAARRLNCFDRAAQMLDEAITARSVIILDRQQIRQAKRTLFGFDLPALAVLGSENKAEPPFVAIDTTVNRVAPAGYGKYDITVEGGAVWRNIELLDAPPGVGETVHISRTTMGGYFLKSRFARAVRASRVR